MLRLAQSKFGRARAREREREREVVVVSLSLCVCVAVSADDFPHARAETRVVVDFPHFVFFFSTLSIISGNGVAEGC